MQLKVDVHHGVRGDRGRVAANKVPEVLVVNDVAHSGSNRGGPSLYQLREGGRDGWSEHWWRPQVVCARARSARARKLTMRDRQTYREVQFDRVGRRAAIEEDRGELSGADEGPGVNFEAVGKSEAMACAAVDDGGVLLVKRPQHPSAVYRPTTLIDFDV